ncbi:O52I1 protein, partial [Turnix velox]|nr:O52I1 protein [Turnix velox]
PFILVGIPDLELSPTLLGFLFFSSYLITLLGNGLVLLLILLDKSLRTPTHCFLAMLAFIDVLMVTSVVPKMLSTLWLKAGEIGQVSCFFQMFLVHSTTSAESGVLLAMAIDRYVAICHPLRYQTILSHQTISHMALAITLRALLFILPLTGLVSHLSYCHSHLLPHSYCEHMALAKLACGDTKPSQTYSLLGSSFIVAMDLTFIMASYGMILKAVLGKEKTCQKALRTCGCHLSLLLLYYVPGMVSIYAQRVGSGVRPREQVLLADIYLTLPTMLNPIIY